jgi:hypothetical protein
MPLTEMVVMIAMVAGFLVGFIQILRLIQTMILHKTVRKAVEKDPASAEPLLARLAMPAGPRSGEDRLALILVAIGIAMILAPVIAVDDPGLIRAAIAAAVFPLIVGFALGLRLFLMRRAARRAPGE